MDTQKPTQHLCSFILILIYFFPLISVIFFFFEKKQMCFWTVAQSLSLVGYVNQTLNKDVERYCI